MTRCEPGKRVRFHPMQGRRGHDAEHHLARAYLLPSFDSFENHTSRNEGREGHAILHMVLRIWTLGNPSQTDHWRLMTYDWKQINTALSPIPLYLFSVITSALWTHRPATMLSNYLFKDHMKYIMWPDIHPHHPQTFHGACPPSQSDSRSCFSRRVSIGCQKPVCRNTINCPSAASNSSGSRSRIVWSSLR